MVPFTSHGGHSAQVKMELLLEGKAIPVAQMGPDFILIDSPFDYPPGNAGLSLQIDDNVRQWNVLLPNGISASSSRVDVVAEN